MNDLASATKILSTQAVYVRGCVVGGCVATAPWYPDLRTYEASTYPDREVQRKRDAAKVRSCEW